MPNWCENTLWISGDASKVKEFVEKAKGEDTDLSLNNFVPTPEELLTGPAPNLKRDDETDEEHKARMQTLKDRYGYTDWFDWRIAHWGTKWDVQAEVNYEEGDCSAVFTFDSAWSPPIEWLEAVSRLYPELHFSLKYDEPGMTFMGCARGSQGEISDTCIEY